jgi:hypothetical protein
MEYGLRWADQTQIVAGGGISHVGIEPRADDAAVALPGRKHWRQLVGDAAEAHPRFAVAASLVGLAAAAAALHAFLAGLVDGPRVFMDELGYEQLARSFANTGHFVLYGKTGLAYSPLYPIVLSPIYRLTSSIGTAYEWAKVENAVLLSLSVFPVYGIARTVLSRKRSVGVAALSLIAPLMLASGFEMSESLAYPVGLVAIWAMLRAARSPGVANDALMLAVIVLATAARLQFVVLFPAALTAILLVALLRRDRAGGRRRAVIEAGSEHWLLVGVVALAFVAFVARWAMNGGNLPLAGRYASVGTSHASPLRVFELFFQHLGELDFAVGVIPFACAILGGYALVRFGYPRKGLIFASVAVATTGWLLLEVAYDAAAYDALSQHPRHVSGPFDVPRIHERYLIYLVPLFLVALVAALPLLRSRFPSRRHLVIAGVAAALPATIPFGNVISNVISFESMSLQPFAKVVHGELVPIPHATRLIVILSALLAFGYLRAAVRPLPSLAVSMTAVALFGLSVLELERQAIPVARSGIGLPAHKNWVDQAVGNTSDVSLVGGARVDAAALEETAYWNPSITRVYYTCGIAFGTDFGEERLTVDRRNGALASPSGTLRTRYAVVPAAIGFAGRVVATDGPGKLVLLAPAGGVLKVPAGPRPLRCR